jgi:hypothetical protein
VGTPSDDAAEDLDAGYFSQRFEYLIEGDELARRLDVAIS